MGEKINIVDWREEQEEQEIELARVLANQKEILEQILMEEEDKDSIVAENERWQKLLEAIEKLDDKEKNVIKLRFGLGENRESHTLAEIGKMYGVGRNSINQIDHKARLKLSRLLKK